MVVRASSAGSPRHEARSYRGKVSEQTCGEAILDMPGWDQQPGSFRPGGRRAIGSSRTQPEDFVNLRRASDWLKARWHGLGWAVHGWFSPWWTRFQRVLALRRNRRQRFRFELAVCGIFRDEAPFIDEWLTLHHAVGIDHFYLYNNESTDNFREVLKPWIQRGVVTLIDWPDPADQIRAYNDCVGRFRMQARWIAFIDLDEFLFSPQRTDVREVLTRYGGVPAIYVYWVMFGSNGHKARPAAPVIESYTRCLDLKTAAKLPFPWAKQGKSIVNPRLIRRFHVHHAEETWSGETLDENFRLPQQRQTGPVDISGDVLRINHYRFKSEEDLRLKIARGNWFRTHTAAELWEKWTEIDKHLHRTKDETLLEIWRDVRDRSPHA